MTMDPLLIYCYDAYCGWCYGFSPVISRLARQYADRLRVEVLSGGMILTQPARPISVMAGYILQAYPVVEQRTGIHFGEDFLWHIRNPGESDWFPSSEKPAIALCVFREFHPHRQVEFAADLQAALHAEGRDLCDDEAYRHLLEKYAIPDTLFYERLHDPSYKQLAYNEFTLVGRLGVRGFPAVLLQVSESRFYRIAEGYTDYATLQSGLEQALEAAS